MQYWGFDLGDGESTLARVSSEGKNYPEIIEVEGNKVIITVWAIMRDGESLKLVGDLLEALYADNGDYALRQLRQLTPWLRRQGVEVVDYGADSAELFELLPTKKAAATQRPALVADGKLLLVGRATEHIDG